MRDALLAVGGFGDDAVEDEEEGRERDGRDFSPHSSKGMRMKALFPYVVSVFRHPDLEASHSAQVELALLTIRSGILIFGVEG